MSTNSPGLQVFHQFYRVQPKYPRIKGPKDRCKYTGAMEKIIFGGIDSNSVHFEKDVEKVFEKWTTLEVVCERDLNISSGPYYAHKGLLHSVSKVYPDCQLAFVQATCSSSERIGEFIQTTAAGNAYRAHGIAIPARSYSIMSFPLPIHEGPGSVLKGVLIQRLETVHILKPIPFNRILQMCSSGGAAAIAAYDWIDLSICSDTTGSVRIPAFQTGIFGFRPSTDSISSNGLVKAWADVDTPGWIGRDEVFPDVFRALHPSVEQDGRTPISEDTLEILYPTDFMCEDDAEQHQAMKSFLSDVSKATRCSYRSISIREDWQKTTPIEEKDLHRYLYNLMHHGWYYAAYHSFDKFRHEYEERHSHGPFVTDVVRWYWALGSQVSLEQHTEMMKRISVFRSWFLEHYSSPQMLMAIHIDSIKSRYRDEYPGNNNTEVPGLRPTDLASILRAPALAIPSKQNRLPFFCF
ncbi:amidase signature domain-containing protein [Talaromyces proteolyticus]|uniref:Amidase signature domain-containing protein n=1 Tax=Talaromyces proteolyticus TaxID=1131652 RepID=A0AAD4L6X0_9EURO|nr:amidase signature domain-containing protein [Talaromyces proteolyticus]KAH8705064.1 amidase signature domain-containing protein [Talaromyces proteolyticus]